jgi:TonB-dependent starch-binding outer membrane protein SusC
MKKKHLWGFDYCFLPIPKKLLQIMKLSILLTCMFTVNIMASVYSQQARFDLDIKDQTVRDVLKAIEKESQFRFFYNDEFSDLNKKVTFSTSDKSIDELLSLVLSNTEVSYKVLENNFVVITPKTILQEVKISGTITDATTGEVLIGVNIVEEGTSHGTVSDANGNYSITVEGSNAVLAFSYIGYIEEKVTVAGQSVINIQLSSDIRSLEEVVVIGYGTQKKKDITTSVSNIKMEDTEKKSMANLAQALQGKAAGVRVVQGSGKPEGDFSIQVRGATSITAGNEPLYVVDGIPTSSLTGINPVDIESMQILKDASSCAIYGARAANGVVLINTKRGSPNKSLVSFRAVYGVSQVGKKLDLLNAKQCAQLLNDEKINAGLAPIVDPDTITTDINWQDEIFFKGKTSDVQLSFSGGNDKTRFYISGGRMHSDGIIKPSLYERYSVKVNLDHELFKWLSLGSTINLSRSKNSNIADTDPTHGQGVILEALAYTTPYTPKYKPNGDFGANPHQGGWANPYSYMYGSNAATRISSLLGNVFAKVTLAKGLSFKTSLAIDANFQNFDKFDLQAHSEYNRSLGGNAYANASQQLVWLNENILDYNLTSGKHAISALAGMTRQQSHWEGSYMQKQGFPDDKVQTLNAGAILKSASTNASEWTLQSYLVRMTYAFDNKYLFSANFRTDGSSKFGPSNKYGYFPSASVGWRISQEQFFSNIRAVNDLKLRLSYGLTGNQNGINEYGHLGLIGLGAVYPFGGIIYPGSYPSTIANRDLKWETTKQTDIGMDLSLFKSRITLTLDAYFKKTSDLLLNVDLPTSSGYSNGIQNLGKIDNKGFEVEVNTYNTVGRFKWSTDVNFSINRNNVVDIGGKEKIMYTAGEIRERGQVTIIKEGQPLSMFYGYISNGVDPQTGDIVYKRNSISSDYKFNPDSDRYIIGNPNPKFIYGINNTFSYLGFSLSILIQGVYGNDIFNGTRLTLEDMEQVKNASAATLRRWKNPGDITDIPRANFGNSDNSMASSRFVEKGTYVRVKSITLSYDFSSKWLKAAHISGLNFFVSGQNLLTLTKYTGFDPEVSWAGNTISPGDNSGTRVDNAVSLGVDYGTYPNVRTYNVGINVNF